jgi:hypothetical protein
MRIPRMSKFFRQRAEDVNKIWLVVATTSYLSLIVSSAFCKLGTKQMAPSGGSS